MILSASCASIYMCTIPKYCSNLATISRTSSTITCLNCKNSQDILLNGSHMGPTNHPGQQYDVIKIHSNAATSLIIVEVQQHYYSTQRADTVHSVNTGDREACLQKTLLHKQIVHFPLRCQCCNMPQKLQTC